MEYENIGDRIVACVFSIIGGMVSFAKFFFVDGSYWVSLMRAGFTAFVCALCGLGAKRLVTFVHKKWKSRKQKR